MARDDRGNRGARRRVGTDRFAPQCADGARDHQMPREEHSANLPLRTIHNRSSVVAGRGSAASSRDAPPFPCCRHLTPWVACGVAALAVPGVAGVAAVFVGHHCSSSYAHIVNFNVYVSDDLARRLAALAKRSGTKRNTIIRKALESWVSRAGATWPDVVLQWSGEPTAVPFESLRSELGEVPDDPFEAKGQSRRRPASGSRRKR